MSGATTKPDTRGLFVPPSNQPPDDYCCRRLVIPKGLDWLALVNGAVSLLLDSDNWQDDDASAVETAVDEFTAMWLTYLGEYQVMLGAIIPFATDILPSNMLWCDGSVYNRVDFPDLYGRLDAAFIVDADTFRTPDLRERFAFGASDSYPVGATGGEAEHTLTESEMPPHSHTVHSHLSVLAVAPGEVPFNTTNPLPGTTGITGGGLAHNNMPPHINLKYAIVAKYRDCC